MPRQRFRLLTAILLVAASAVGLAAALELGVWGPERRARRALLAHHARRADYLAREAAVPAPYFRDEPELKRELNDLAAWHARRVREIRQAPRFDARKEQLIDAPYAPVEGRLVTWLSLRKYAHQEY